MFFRGNRSKNLVFAQKSRNFLISAKSPEFPEKFLRKSRDFAKKRLIYRIIGREVLRLPIKITKNSRFSKKTRGIAKTSRKFPIIYRSCRFSGGSPRFSPETRRIATLFLTITSFFLQITVFPSRKTSIFTSFCAFPAISRSLNRS